MPRTSSLRGKVDTSPTRVAPTTTSVRGATIKRGYWWAGAHHKGAGWVVGPRGTPFLGGEGDASLGFREGILGREMG